MRSLLRFTIYKNSRFTIPADFKYFAQHKHAKFYSDFLHYNKRLSVVTPSISINRHSSDVYVPPVPVALTGTAVAKDESREFMAVFPDIVRDLTDAGRHLDIPDVTRWYAKALQYNVPGGKKNRGLALVTSFRAFCPPSELTPENIRLAQILGWCVEMLQAFLLVIDDIEDDAKLRRGRPCWYRADNVGMIAINDGILLENGIYVILKKYFSSKQCYVQLLEMFHDVTLKTSMGQSLDLLMCRDYRKNRKLDKFTMDRYKGIVKYKTAYYSFQLPVALAMYMTGISDAERHRQVKHVLLQMGDYYQIQDDYLGCFGNPELIGKACTDIEVGKCTWLLVVALQRASAKQKAILEECYGQSDPRKVEMVKQIYKDIGLPSIYAVYEEDTYKLIVDQIQQLSRGLPQELFFKILDKIHQRRI